MLHSLEETGRHPDPFDEYEGFDSDEEEVPSDPAEASRYEMAGQLLDILASPGFRRSLEEFRLQDPGKLVRRNARRMRERAYLLDPSRLMMGTLLCIAMQRESFDGTRALPAWIDRRIDESIDELLIVDQEDERAGTPIREPLQARYAHIVRNLQVEVANARRACIVINGFTLPKRKVFFEIAFMLQPIRSLVEAGMGSRKELTGLLRSALDELERSDIGFDARLFQRGAGKPLDLEGGYGG